MPRRLGSTVLAKAEGMLRFHLQGQHPLAEQSCPEVLQSQRDILVC